METERFRFLQDSDSLTENEKANMQKTAAGASDNRKRACCGMSSYSEIIRQSRTNDRPAFTRKSGY